MHFLLRRLTGDSTGSSELHEAAKSGDISRVRTLTQRGGQVDKLDAAQRTPLHYAAAAGFDAVVGELLDRQAAVTLQDQNGSTPLHLAAQAGKLKAVQLLTGPRNRAEGVEKLRPLSMLDKRGYDPLQLAAEAGYAEVVADLAPKMGGAELWRTTPDGYTAMLLAAAQGHVAVMEVLAARGAAISARSARTGASALHLAAAGGHMPAVEWLGARGAALKAIDNESRTALDVAREMDQPAVLRLLKDLVAANAAGSASRANAGEPSAPLPPGRSSGGGAGERNGGGPTSPRLGQLPFGALPPEPVGPVHYPSLPPGAASYY